MSTDDMRAARNKAMDARRRKRNQLAQLRGEPIGMLDVGPIRVKVKALVDLGWSYEAIAHASQAQVTSAGLRLIANGSSRRCERKFAPVAAMPLTLRVPTCVPDTCLVPSLGATRRVRALMALGWRHDDIGEFIERSSHHLSAGLYPRMLALDWHLVDQAYSRLSGTPGGSAKSKTRAVKAGYVPPLAWRDIDNPREQPRNWAFVEPTRADVVAELSERGATISDACRALGISQGALERWCERNEMRPEYNRMVSRERGVA